MSKALGKTLQIAVPFLLGGGILWWMYRNTDFSQISDVLLHQMRWEWMLLSFIPGILAQVFRALRWRQTLQPMGEHCRSHVAICAIFLSYAASLVVPRVGEFLRCGILKRKDGVSFPKALGTVVTERAVDMLIMLMLLAAVIVWQWDKFTEFFALTGLNLSTTLSRFTSTGIWVSILCVVGIVVLIVILARRLSVMRKVKAIMRDMAEGIMSLRKVSNIPLYIFYSFGIWAAYFFHYYLTFYCFGFTENLGLAAGLVSFCTGGIAVLVPTPNGAGPWHFAVKTILVLYGLTATSAIIFALIVHTVQTMLLVVLGVYALIVLQRMNTLKDSKDINKK
ncbi:MAG: flippase-like domain-containing protein [Bacteroidaceae bacterium]|nr:flippase-like domain-containing protein [Bacteroidaceae bacterium]